MASCCIIWTVNTFIKYLSIIWSNFSEIFWQFYVKYKNYEIYQKKIDLTLLTVNKVHIKKYSGGASIHKINEAIFSCFRIYFTGIHLCIQQTKHLQCSFLNPNYFFFPIWVLIILIHTSLKSILFQKNVLTFHGWKICPSDLKVFANSRPSTSNSKSFSESMEQFFLTIGQTNFRNTILRTYS